MDLHSIVKGKGSNTFRRIYSAKEVDNFLPIDLTEFGDTLNPEITILYQFHDQKALFKVPKICNINFWIENDPPPLLHFSENSFN